DDSSNQPVPSDRREAVREKAQQVHAKQSRSRVLRRAAIVVAGLVVVGGAAAAVTWTLTSMGPRPQLEPANATKDGFAVNVVSGAASTTSGTAVGDAAASQDAAAAGSVPTPSPTTTATSKVDIRVYVDYLSTGAREFQLANSTQLSKWVDQGAATLTYYP
ncbi:hypothetical protein NRA21_17885, partial [Acinetobacter baumannii]|nr:hypothetical protein [Acinetobacter baumannii]